MATHNESHEQNTIFDTESVEYQERLVREHIENAAMAGKKSCTIEDVWLHSEVKAMLEEEGRKVCMYNIANVGVHTDIKW